MNKEDVAEKMAAKSGMTKKDSAKALNAFIAVVTDALVSGDKVQLVGFGSFEKAKRSARKGRNPMSGEEIDIPETLVPKFDAGSTLRKAVR